MNQVVILALIAALQQEVVLLEQELAQQQAIVSPVPYSPYLGSVPTIGTNGGDVAPTSTPDGSPIVYVPAPTSTPSVPMCEYVIPGVKTIEGMSCAEIQACTTAHNCPR